MIRTLREPSTAVAELEDMPLYSSELDQMAVDSEQAMAPKRELPRRPAPEPARPPRPFAFD
jgi:hypothetical protein